jgi:hypothetical protein
MPAKGDDDGRLDNPYLFVKPGHASVNFFGAGVTILGRSILYDIGDIDVFAPESDSGEHFIEKFPCRTDKGYPLEVLVFPGRFTDKQNLGVSTPVPRYRLGGRVAQAAGTLDSHASIQDL